MFGAGLGAGSFIVAFACLAIVMETPGTALGQQGTGPRQKRAKRPPQRKSAAKSQRRPEAGVDEKSVADRIVLRDGRELAGQVERVAS